MTSCGYLHYYTFRARINSLPFDRIKIDEWLNFVDAVHTSGFRTEEEKQVLYCQTLNSMITYAHSVLSTNIVYQLFGTVIGSVRSVPGIVTGAGSTIKNIGTHVANIVTNPISWLTVAAIAAAIVVVKLT